MHCHALIWRLIWEQDGAGGVGLVQQNIRYYQARNDWHHYDSQTEPSVIAGLKIWGKIEHCFVRPILINFQLEIMSTFVHSQNNYDMGEIALQAHNDLYKANGFVITLEPQCFVLQSQLVIF